MAIRVNPKLIHELEQFGSEDVHNCYHCGNCSAVCPHTDETFVFPRKSMRSLQMGLERKLEKSIEPWLCYYCGQCSEQCPRDAEPGETMMSLRRWLISRYDFTGLARLFYKSWKSELAAVIAVALLTGIGLLAYGFWQGDIRVYDGPGAFLPSSSIHIFDLAVGGVMFLFLAANALRMWWLIMDPRAQGLSWGLYVKKIPLLPWHFFTQKRYAECESAGQPGAVHIPWLMHLGIVLGYVTMLVLVMVFLHPLQAGPQIQWSVHVFGYLASIGLTAGTIYVLRGRLKKTRVQYLRSQGSDWMFVTLLFVITVTGILQHVLHRADLPLAANIVYVLHLMVVVPWLLRMPFSKWSHMIYRTLAMYFADIQRGVLAARATTTSAIPEIRQAA
jgi:quinone-modifying oxidoreductase, subunit QmoC